MSGLMMDERFVAVFPSLIRRLGNAESAILLQHIHWSAGEETGTARVTMPQLSEETGIPLRTVERRIKELRGSGWLSAERAAAFDATLVYRVVRLDLDPAKVADSIPGGGLDPARVAGSETAKVAGSSTQNLRTSRSSSSDEPTPEQHPSRQVSSWGGPSLEWVDYLAVTYPDVDIAESTRRFTRYHLSKQSTSKSWEALLGNWVSNDQQRIDETKLAGTDDLGVPLKQRRVSVVGDALKPGDEGYFDASAYAEQLPDA